MVVSTLSFYSVAPSLNPVGYCIILYLEKTKINKEEARLGFLSAQTKARLVDTLLVAILPISGNLNWCS